MAQPWPLMLEDPASWRHLAQHARSDAERCVSAENRTALRGIADRYERLAERAAAANIQNDIQKLFG